MIILEKLRIKNLAIVSETEVDFGDGLSVITGETGTGKSLLVGAISLLLGERGRTEMVRSGSKVAVVEGVFSGDLARLAGIFAEEDIVVTGDELSLVRELSTDGRSRCLVNDSRVNVTVLRRIGERICDLHGQHQHQWLLEPSRHLWFLDRYADCVDRYERYLAAYSEYRREKTRLAELQRETTANRERRELYRYQLEEIGAAAVTPGEESELEQERRELENVNRIKEKLYDSLAKLEDDSGAIGLTASVTANLDSIVDDLAAAKELLAELESARISLVEISRLLEEQASRLAENPDRLEVVGERLSVIYGLKRKYGGSVEAMMEQQRQIGEFLNREDSLEDELQELERKISHSGEQLLKAAEKLHEARVSGATALARKMQQQLKRLGMSKPLFRVEFGDCAAGELVEQEGASYRLSEIGFQEGEFLFSANAGEEARPLRKIASGGEISRVMLALKSLISGKDRVDLLVFDEVDAGIGGETALLVGQQLRELAGKQQVIAITHLQQIAAYSQRHYRAVKATRNGRTESHLEALDDAERIVELGRMISGGKFGEIERRQAEKLLAQAGRAGGKTFN